MKVVAFLEESLKNLRKFYGILLLLAVSNFLLVIFAFSMASKAASVKPIVIKVEETGRAKAIAQSNTYHEASPVEIRYLAKFIVETLFSFSILTYKRDFQRILPYLSPSLKEELRKIFRKLTRTYLQRRASVNASVFSVEILSNPEEKLVQVRVDYWKEQEEKREKRYCLLVFRKVKRNLENPFGLLLEELRERAYLEGGRR
jgi:type IV secretory pathway TrbF-like protein